MQIEELNRLSSWIIANVEKSGLIGAFTKLVQKMQTNARPNQSKVPFEDERQVLIDLLEQVDLRDLTEQQISLLHLLSLRRNLGEAGVEKVQSILTESGVDIATASKSMNAMKSEIQSGLKWAKDISPHLAKVSQTDDSGALEIDEVLIRVRFTGDASINNVVDLKKWSNDWHDIGRGIALAVGGAPEDVVVVSATSGSIIATLKAKLEFAKIFLKIVDQLTNLTKDILEVRIQVAQLKKLKIDTEISQKQLLKASEEQKAETIQVIVVNVLDSMELGDAEGDIRPALERSVEKLDVFFDKGGEVDFLLPDHSESDLSDEYADAFSQLKTLKDQVRNIRETNQTIGLLGTSYEEE